MPCFLDTYVAWNTLLRTRGSGVRIPSGALFIKEFFGSPGHEIGNEQIEPLTDNKTVRQPGAAPVGRRRFSGGGPERSGGRAAQPRAIRPGAPFQIWSKPPISRLDRQLGGRPYMAIRQLSNVRAAPQVTT